MGQAQGSLVGSHVNCLVVGPAVVAASRLSVASCPHLLIKQVGTLRGSQIIPHSAEHAALYLFLRADGFEEKRFALHIYIQNGQFPVTGLNLFLLHIKMSTCVQMPQQASAEFYGVPQMSRNFRQAFLPSVDPQRAFHRMHDSSLMRRRPEVRIRLEFHFDQISSLFPIFKDQGVRQRFQQPLTSHLVFVFFSLCFFQLCGITYQALETSLSLASLVLRKRLRVHRNQPIQVTVLGLYYFPHFCFSGFPRL